MQASWLGQLGAGGPKYTEYAMGSHSLLETLYRVPSCKPDVAHLFETLPHLQPRMYSISSSPLYHRGQAHLTIAEVGAHSGFSSSCIFFPVRTPDFVCLSLSVGDPVFAEICSR